MGEAAPPGIKWRVRAGFERAAATYDQVAVLQREVGGRLLERVELLRAFTPRWILDLGAGTGHATGELARRYRGARVIAVDLSVAMLTQARRRGPWFGRPRCVCGDLEQLPLPDGCADLVFSNLALQWCAAPDTAFQEFRRVLRPGGVVMFTTFGPDTLKELREAWAEADRYSHVNPFLDMHDIGDALVRARLAEPVMDVERLTLTYERTLDLVRDLQRLGSRNVGSARPRGLTGRGRIETMTQRYEAVRTDGRLPATFEVVYGHAWAPLGPESGPAPGAPVQVSLERLRRPGR
ncbi:MAG: malonyl-ACP O-methyltransferase BioC [Gammaproteobacteria bacterium]